MQSLTFLQLYEHCKCNYASDTHGQVHVHAGMLTSSIIICMHALHVITLKHCHIVAMDMIFSCPTLCHKIADIRSAFDKTLASEHLTVPLTVRRSREARLCRASLLLCIYIAVYTVQVAIYTYINISIT